MKIREMFVEVCEVILLFSRSAGLLLTLVLITGSSAQAAGGMGLQEVHEGGGWVVHRLGGVNDILLGCEPPASVEACTQVLLPGYIPGTSLEFVFVDTTTGTGWLVAHRPVVGDLLFVCRSPLAKPSCERVTLPEQPSNAAFSRVGRVRGGPPEGGAGGPAPPVVLGGHLPGGNHVHHTHDEDGPGGAIWLSVSIPVVGDVSLYACRDLEGEPNCAAAAEHLLKVDRVPAGFRRLADMEVGVEVRALAPGGPAEQAGLRPGDVVVAVAGLPVHSVLELHGALAQMSADEPIDVLTARGELRKITLGRGSRAIAAQAVKLSPAGAARDERNEEVPADEDDEAIGVLSPDLFEIGRITPSNASRVASRLSEMQDIRSFHAAMTLLLEDSDAEFRLAIMDLGFAISFTPGGTLVLKGEEVLVESLDHIWVYGSVEVDLHFSGDSVIVEVDGHLFSVVVQPPEGGTIRHWRLDLPQDGLVIEDFALRRSLAPE